MKKTNFSKKICLKIIVILLFSLGFFFRIYKLDWGAPYFFHPDERNIASAVTRLSFPLQMNPEFFAYGSLPIYTNYLINVIKNLPAATFTQSDVFRVKFEDAIITGRVISFFLSIGVVYFIYKISNLFVDKKSSIVAALLGTFSVGLIQYAHFLTFEMWITFFSLNLVFLILEYLKKGEVIDFIFINIILGILVSIKISSLIFIPFIYMIFVVSKFSESWKSKQKIIKITLNLFLQSILGLLLALLIVVITSPFFLFDWKSFTGSISYETEVATGKMAVFYTQSFINTIPIFYQTQKIYPFILNPFVFLFFIFVFPIVLYQSIKDKQINLLLVISFLAVTFFSQAFLFVKWTRYYIPTLPFIYILIAIYIGRIKKPMKIITSLSLIIISFVYSFSYIKSNLSFSSPIVAAKWFSVNNKSMPTSVSEIYDMGIVPFNNYSIITLFNFYDLEVDNLKSKELDSLISNSEYIILPSQRILKDRLTKSNLYPKGSIFYKNLVDGTLGFKKIYETPCDIFCKILYLNDPIYSFESTANVFDRPQVMVFKK